MLSVLCVGCIEVDDDFLSPILTGNCFLQFYTEQNSCVGIIFIDALANSPTPKNS